MLRKHWIIDERCAVVYDDMTGLSLPLSETATRIWQLSDGTRELEDIARLLSEEYDISPNDALHQSQQFILAAERMGLMVSETRMFPKVLLVEPWSFAGFGPPPDKMSEDNLLGLGYLAAMLNASGYWVRILDLRRAQFDSLIDTLIKCRPDIVGISANSVSFHNAAMVATIAKQTLPLCVTILGGPHCAFCDSAILGNYPQVDAVVTSEGEPVIIDIAEAVASERPLCEVLGVSARKGHETVLARSRPKWHRLDDLPIPDYPAFITGPQPTVTNWRIISSRGCPHHCSFCSSQAFWGNRVRFRSSASIVDEIRYVRDRYNIRSFSFVDDMVTSHKRRVLELCESLEPEGVAWACSTRVDEVNPDLLERMAQSGCQGIFFGIETFSPQAQALAGKNITAEQVLKVRAWTRDLGMKMQASFIIPLPGETEESIAHTIDFAHKLNADRTEWSPLYALPGTRLAAAPDDYGLVIHRKGWFDYRVPDVSLVSVSRDGVYEALIRAGSRPSGSRPPDDLHSQAGKLA